MITDRDVPMSSTLHPQRGVRRISARERAKMAGMCLNCGQHLTFCGAPFTDAIPCRKCLYINIYKESQQPVSGHW